MNVDKINIDDRQKGMELQVRWTISGYCAWYRRNRLMSLLRALSLWAMLAGIGRSHGGFVRTPFAPFNLTINATTTTSDDGLITLILPPIMASLPLATSSMGSAANQTLAPFPNTTTALPAPSLFSSISLNTSLSTALVTPSEPPTTPSTSLWTSATFSSDPGGIMEQSLETTTASPTLSTSATGLVASILASIAASTPPSPAEVLSSLTAIRPGTNPTASPVAVFSVYWPSSVSTSDSEPLSTATNSEDSADTTATSDDVSIPTIVDPTADPAIATTTGTTFSTSLTDTSSSATSATLGTLIAPANTTAPPGAFGHGHLGHGPGPAAIAVPMSIGTVFALAVLLFLWRKYHAESFHRILDSIPGFGCFARWRKTREKNKLVRRMRRLGILTGDNAGDDTPGTIGATTYARHLKKFEDDAARAREKMSMDTPTRTPASPYTPGRKSKTTASMTALPKFGSPWKSPKAKPSSEGHDGILLTPSPARSTGPRVHGTYKRNYDKAETGSLASWEEKWHALGKDDGKSNSTANSATILRKQDEHGMQKTEKPEDESGPGQSWRKLV